MLPLTLVLWALESYYNLLLHDFVPFVIWWHLQPWQKLLQNFWDDEKLYLLVNHKFGLKTLEGFKRAMFFPVCRKYN